ncbi:uncharacterized protein L969DRAFT_93348 [Mixia osmundae IAM 14324]|uniref:Transcription initiation factor TFIID subunit 13 n=1 Tax=Mixia osmundae (strain CBS 9802 / IAM 14324 / JCM 22182 / KY 12970) TaxID=764103 RepID=G7E5C2_MIXOS|nr:uncharacterized protein L969DRAFT_93348 [Mixia osmundae IAM 14324]KEI40818.1 hypothetical protein L969DRAFT_93348 [Mixia osmundae IAM 14324]GAA98032.1 hypothetical protein E5Q_04712 [Mixia osmundae IAM 14324]
MTSRGQSLAPGGYAGPSKGTTPVPEGGTAKEEQAPPVFVHPMTSFDAQRGRVRTARRGIFNKDLPAMMYGFGDDAHPANDTVNVLEDILVDYIADVCVAAHRVSKNKGKLQVDNLRFALRKPQQAKQLARVEELLVMQTVISQAKGNAEGLQTYAEEEDKIAQQQQQAEALARLTKRTGR